MLKFCERVSKNIDDLTVKLGKLSIWIILALILVLFSCLILKNIFGITQHFFLNLNLNALGLIMLAGSSYAILTDEHLRKTFLCRKFSLKKQALINLLSAIFLIVPTAMILFGLSWTYIAEEWRAQEILFSWEKMAEASFLRAISLLFFMSVITIFTQLTALAAISSACKSIIILNSKSLLVSAPSNNEKGG